MIIFADRTLGEYMAGRSEYKRVWKPLFDRVFALSLIVVLFPIGVFLFLACWVDTGANGVFTQMRIGQHGRSFKIYKFRSIHPHSGQASRFGRWIRNSKIDELPQLVNILKGEMSFVGPRPDVPGYYDRLAETQVAVLELKPGLTSEAGLKYREEDALLAAQSDSVKFNDEVLFPDKVRMNLEYLKRQSFAEDVRIVFKTVKVLLFNKV